jgi:amidohydrolase
MAAIIVSTHYKRRAAPNTTEAGTEEAPAGHPWYNAPMNLHRLLRIVPLFLVLGGPIPAAPQARPLDQKIAALTAELAPGLIAVRRDIHEHPELSLQETRTAALVAEAFRSLGLEVRTGIGGTGVLGVLRGAKPGPVIAMRGDMDALPITEETGLPFASRARGVRDGRDVGIMHACGHDIHTTVLIGTARVLTRLKAELAGTILFIAQPAEEYGEGAKGMVADGVFRDLKPEAIYAFHVDDTLPVGRIKFTPGWAAANVDGFRLVIHSDGCHGASPQSCLDPIVVGAQIVLGLQVMIARELDVHNDTVITVGSFHAGTASNIIPKEAVLDATVRTYGEDHRARVKEKITRLITAAAQGAGAKFEMDYYYGTPALFNDPRLTAAAVVAARRVLGNPDSVIEEKPEMGGEDFSVFAQNAPSAMLYLGILPKTGSTGSLHSPTFTADEAGIAAGVNLMSVFLADYLRLHPAGAKR